MYFALVTIPKMVLLGQLLCELLLKCDTLIWHSFRTYVISQNVATTAKVCALHGKHATTFKCTTGVPERKRQREWLAHFNKHLTCSQNHSPSRDSDLNAHTNPGQEPNSKTTSPSTATSPDELRPLAPELEAGGADSVGVLRRQRAGGEGGGVNMAPTEEELHQRNPFRPRMRYIHSCRSVSSKSKAAS